MWFPKREAWFVKILSMISWSVTPLPDPHYSISLLFYNISTHEKKPDLVTESVRGSYDQNAVHEKGNLLLVS